MRERAGAIDVTDSKWEALSCWITVGDVSIHLYVRQEAGQQELHVNAYRTGAEMSEPLDGFYGPITL